MGNFNVPATVGNPNTAVREPVSALVDTGSTFSKPPANLLQRLGITPHPTPAPRQWVGRGIPNRNGVL